VASIIRYLFIIIFLSITSAILGVTYKNLVIFASALGVGIGFGLQNIVNNFISGIILLFEQPIRVGDIIEVNGLFSKVKHIGIRSTIVESLDNSSIIIPNSEILSNKLINWTLNNNIIAIKCEVGVAYGTDTKLVESILDEVAVENLHVLKFPHHQVWFNEFADSSLNFVLKVWINKPEEKYIIHSALMHRINQKIADAGVTIPFPQRDIHIKENNFKVKSD
jgi:small-conductance mechanosensitive channel